MIDQPFVRRNLAKCHAGAEALKLMLWKQAWTLTHSRLHPADASTVKVYASEFFVEAYRAADGGDRRGRQAPAGARRARSSRAGSSACIAPR